MIKIFFSWKFIISKVDFTIFSLFILTVTTVKGKIVSKMMTKKKQFTFSTFFGHFSPVIPTP